MRDRVARKISEMVAEDRPSDEIANAIFDELREPTKEQMVKQRIRSKFPPEGERIVAMLEHRGAIIIATESGVYMLDPEDEHNLKRIVTYVVQDMPMP